MFSTGNGRYSCNPHDMMSEPMRNDYDAVPYQSAAVPQTHPRRFAVIATLFGMQPAALENCRVLELGCAEGGNLIPMAVDFPESEFLGIDLSERQIEIGNQTVQGLGLQNLSLRHLNLLDVDESFGRFDYIIAHGIYTWVPEEAQKKLFEICRRNLAPQGVAYVSYNTYPGGHLRKMVRELLLYHLERFPDTQQHAEEARNFLNFLTQSIPEDRHPSYRAALEWERGHINRSQDHHFLHDILEDVNQPVLFRDFVEKAQQHDLQYLGEIKFHEMMPRNFPADVFETLKRHSRNLIEIEQYMDFFRFRSFRQTLLCHANITLNRVVEPHRVRKMYIGSSLKPESAIRLDDPNEEIRFRNPDGSEVKSRNPLVKAALSLLQSVWPQNMPFESLLEKARQKMVQSFGEKAVEANWEQGIQTLCNTLLQCYAGGLIEFDVRPTACECRVTEQPKTSALVSYQSRHGNTVTNQRHETVRVTPLQQFLLQKLDGTNGRETLLDEALSEGKDKNYFLDAGTHAINEPNLLRETLAEKLQMELENLAGLGLLTG